MSVLRLVLRLSVKRRVPVRARLVRRGGRGVRRSGCSRGREVEVESELVHRVDRVENRSAVRVRRGRRDHDGRRRGRALTREGEGRLTSLLLVLVLRVSGGRNGGEVISDVRFVREVLLLDLARMHELADGRSVENVAETARRERGRVVDAGALLLTALVALRRERLLLVEEEAEDASSLAAEALRAERTVSSRSNVRREWNRETYGVRRLRLDLLVNGIDDRAVLADLGAVREGESVDSENDSGVRSLVRDTAPTSFRAGCGGESSQSKRTTEKRRTEPYKESGRRRGGALRSGRPGCVSIGSEGRSRREELERENVSPRRGGSEETSNVRQGRCRRRNSPAREIWTMLLGGNETNQRPIRRGQGGEGHTKLSSP